MTQINWKSRPQQKQRVGFPYGEPKGSSRFVYIEADAETVGLLEQFGQVKKASYAPPDCYYLTIDSRFDVAEVMDYIKHLPLQGKVKEPEPQKALAIKDFFKDGSIYFYVSFELPDGAFDKLRKFGHIDADPPGIGGTGLHRITVNPTYDFDEVLGYLKTLEALPVVRPKAEKPEPKPAVKFESEYTESKANKVLKDKCRGCPLLYFFCEGQYEVKK